MLDTTITWGDLFKVALFVLATGVLFYLLLAVANLVGILKNVKKILDKNRSNIDNTLEKLPEITENVANISDMLKKEMESIQKVVKNVGKITETAKDTADVLKNDVLVKAKGIVDIIEWIRKLFDKEEKKKEIIYKYKYKPGEVTVIQDNSPGNGCSDNRTVEHDFVDKDGNNDCSGESKKAEERKNRENENQQGAGI